LDATAGALDGPGAEPWDAVYRRVRPRLDAYCRRRLPADAAEDAVSETLARAVAGRHRYRDRGLGIDAWLFGICRNVVLDAQRRAGRRRQGVPAEAAWSPHAPGPLDHVLGAEEADALRVAFAQLGESDREVLELRVVAGLDADATASVLGKRPGAVRMAQARALSRLRALLLETHGEVAR
jgi:RNA polymerase sigma-70 factor, ECF subfamily